MFDFLRNLTKSAEEKRQETIAAYVDGMLNGRSRQQFEQALAQDEALRQEVAQLQLIKQSLRQLPLRDVPRNFILDPAEFSRPPARQPWVQAYPALRTATALAAFFFIFALAAGSFTGFGMGGAPSMAPAADVAQVEDVEMTRVVTETVVVESAPAAEQEMAAEESAADTAVEADSFAEAEEAMSEIEAVEETSDEATASQSETTEDGEAVLQATAVPPDSVTPELAPTVSTSPRVTPPTPLPDRDLEQSGLAEDAAASVPTPAVEDETEDAETTAVLSQELVEEVDVDQPASPLLWLQLGLGALLLLLFSLTFYARRQR